MIQDEHNILNVQTFRKHLQNSFKKWKTVSSGNRWERYTFSSSLYIRNADNIHMLVLSSSAAMPQIVDEFIRNDYELSRLALIICLDLKAYQYIKETYSLSMRQVGLLSPLHSQSLMEVSNKKDILKVFSESIQSILPQKFIFPYDNTHPAEGVMFFGRKKELDLLESHLDLNIVVSGPGGCGKTSLVKYYMNRQKQRGQQRIFYADFYGCRDGLDKTITEYLLKTIKFNNIHYHTNPLNTLDMIRYHYNNLPGKGPIEFILDELDAVVTSDVFDRLTEASKLGFCRLIICGRGGVLRATQNTESYFNSRFHHIRIGPLEEDDAYDLFRIPLTSLGIDLEDIPDMKQTLMDVTGGLPDLIQYTAISLTENMKGKNRITVEDVLKLKSKDFMYNSYVTGSLQTLIVEKPSVFKFLKGIDRRYDGKFTRKNAVGVLTNLDIEIKPNQVGEVLNDLVIDNILIWDNHTYRISHDLYREYLRKQ